MIIEIEYSSAASECLGHRYLFCYSMWGFVSWGFYSAIPIRRTLGGLIRGENGVLFDICHRRVFLNFDKLDLDSPVIHDRCAMVVGNFVFGSALCIR